MDRHLGVGIAADALTSVRAEARGLVDAISVAPALVVVPGGPVVIGEEAEHLADAGAGAGFRDFFGRVGDPVPVIGSDGSARSGEELAALTIKQLLTRATRTGVPASMVIAHPASWGSHERTRLQVALAAAGAGTVRTVLVGRPVAAVATALADGLIALGDAVVVVDIGNRATEVSIVADAGGAGRVLGREFTDDLGADVLDHAVQTHVCVESAVTLDTRSPHGRAASRALAAACRAARRELALSPATVIEVACPGRTEHVRMVRTEFESAIAEAIRAGVTAIAACARNGLAEGVDVRAVLLVGEAAATPLLTEMASALLRLPVVVPQYPEWAVAGGAAHITARAAAAAAAEFLANPSLPAQRPVPRRVAPAVAAPRHTAVPAPARPAGSGASPLPADLPRTSWEQPSSQPERSRIRTGMIAAIVAAALVIGGGITVAETGGGHGGGAGAFSHGGP